MKALRIISLLALLPLLGTGTSLAQKDCPPRHVNVITQSGGENGPASLAVHPAIVRVSQGCSVEIWIPPGMTVNTFGANEETDTWLKKSSMNVPITINVSLDQDTGLYKYKIEVVGFGTLDPYVRVTE